MLCGALQWSRIGESFYPHITPRVWRLEGATLVREETLESSQVVRLRRWWIAVPTTATQNDVQLIKGERHYRFESDEGALDVSVTAAWPLKATLLAAGNNALGRGARGPVPLHLLRNARSSSKSTGPRAGE